MAKLFVKAKKGHDGFRRAGRAWPEKGIEVDTEDFTEEELKLLERENGRYLIVEEVKEGGDGHGYKRFRIKSLGDGFELGGQKVSNRWNVFNPSKEKLSPEDIEKALTLFEQKAAEIEVYEENLKKYRPLKEGETLL